MSCMECETLTQKHKIRVGCKIQIPKAGMPEAVISRLTHRLSFNNPRFFKNQRFGHKTDGVPRKITCFWEDEEHFLIPKGSAADMVGILHGHRVPFELEFDEPDFAQVSYYFHGALFPHQDHAIQTMGKRRFGVLIGPTGCGKKVCALYQVSRRNLPALIVTRTRNRMAEWLVCVEKFLQINGQEVGMIGDGQHRFGKEVTIAIDRSLYRHVEALKDKVGFVIVDQCDTANPKIFFKALGELNPKFILGLARHGGECDGIRGVMYAHCGPVVEHIKDINLSSWTDHKAVTKVIKTGFQFDFRDNYAELITSLTEDADRNQMVVQDILHEASHRKSRVVVISERIEHLTTIQRMLAEAYQTATGIVTGTTPEKQRQKIMEHFEKGKLRILLTTLKSLQAMNIFYNMLVIACPFRYDYGLAVALGGICAIWKPDHAPIIYDYLDDVPVLAASFKTRLKAYRRLAFKHAGASDVVQ